MLNISHGMKALVKLFKALNLIWVNKMFWHIS
jgi:hypothetical protein